MHSLYTYKAKTPYISEMLYQGPEKQDMLVLELDSPLK